MLFSSKLESVRIGKCQNWKVSELESVRIGKFPILTFSNSDIFRFPVFFIYCLLELFQIYRLGNSGIFNKVNCFQCLYNLINEKFYSMSMDMDETVVLSF